MYSQAPLLLQKGISNCSLALRIVDSQNDFISIDLLSALINKRPNLTIKKLILPLKCVSKNENPDVRKSVSQLS
jgi:hypothetical protein